MKNHIEGGSSRKNKGRAKGEALEKGKRDGGTETWGTGRMGIEAKEVVVSTRARHGASSGFGKLACKLMDNGERGSTALLTCAWCSRSSNRLPAGPTVPNSRLRTVAF